MSIQQIKRSKDGSSHFLTSPSSLFPSRTDFQIKSFVFQKVSANLLKHGKIKSIPTHLSAGQTQSEGSRPGEESLLNNANSANAAKCNIWNTTQIGAHVKSHPNDLILFITRCWILWWRVFPGLGWLFPFNPKTNWKGYTCTSMAHGSAWEGQYFLCTAGNLGF